MLSVAPVWGMRWGGCLWGLCAGVFGIATALPRVDPPGAFELTDAMHCTWQIPLSHAAASSKTAAAVCEVFLCLFQPPAREAWGGFR